MDESGRKVEVMGESEQFGLVAGFFSVLWVEGFHGQFQQLVSVVSESISFLHW